MADEGDMALTPYHVASSDALLNETGAWWLRATNVFHAWKFTTGYHASIKVGFCDTGIMPHDDLGLPSNYASLFPGDNEYVNRVTLDSHGSEIWGALKLQRNNGKGLSGVSPDAVVNFYRDTGSGSDAAQFAAILDAAAAAGIRILSYSAGGNIQPSTSTVAPIGCPALDDPAQYPNFSLAQAAMRRFVAAGGLLVQAANDANWMEPRDVINVWSRFDRDHTVAVSGYSPDENTTDGHYYTSWGPDIDLVGPAYGVLTNTYQRSGTATGYVVSDWLASGATPLVSGVCALAWSVNPNLTAADVKSILKTTSRKVSHLAGNFNTRLGQYGAGMVNAGKAVKCALSTLSAGATYTEGGATKTVESGQVFPYLGFDGAGASITVNTADGSAATTLNGDVWIDATGFVGGVEVPIVELLAGSRRIYRGPPAQLRARAARYTAGGANSARLTIRAISAAGAVSEETYSDVLVDADVSVEEPYHCVTDDPLLDQQWHHKRINLYHAWKYGRGGSAVKLLVMDTGLKSHASDTRWPVHPDIPDPASIDLGVGIDEYWGTTESHGTTVWSLIKERAGSGIGAAGIAPDTWAAFAALVDPTGDNSWVSESDWAGVFTRATAAGVKIITNSVTFPAGGSSNASPVRAAIDAFLASGGLLFTAAPYGNYYFPAANTCPQAPTDQATVPGTVVVAGTSANEATADDPRGWAPNPCAWGPGIEIVAPSGYPFGAYGYNQNYAAESGGHTLAWPAYNWGGYPTPDTTHHASTSFSTPQVAAVAALVWNINSSLAAADVRSILTSTADVGHHPDFATRYPNAGIVNAGKAAKKALSTLPENAGVPIPYVGFAGTGVTTTIANGAATTTLDGEVFIDASGFIDGDEVDTVEVYHGSTLVYSGEPTILRATASSSGTAQPVRIVATSGTASASEAYSDIAVASLSTGQSISFDFSVGMTSNGSVGLYGSPPVAAASVSFASDASDWVKGELLARNLKLGLSYVAGPYQEIPYPRGDSTWNVGAGFGSDAHSLQVGATPLVHGMGFAADAREAQVAAQQLAARLGFDADAVAVAALQAHAAFDVGIGFGVDAGAAHSGAVSCGSAFSWLSDAGYEDPLAQYGNTDLRASFTDARDAVYRGPDLVGDVLFRVTLGLEPDAFTGDLIELGSSAFDFGGDAAYLPPLYPVPTIEPVVLRLADPLVTLDLPSREAVLHLPDPLVILDNDGD